jgi:alpha-N-arabinofuranosidase
VSVAVSESPTGPYRNNPRNPILTHRHLSYDHPITGVGHADLVETPDGRWFAVALGWRMIDSAHGILGRETFLAPVVWETEPYEWKQKRYTFPVIAPATGRITLETEMPFPRTKQTLQTGFVDEFDSDTLRLEWNMRRTHDERFYGLDVKPGFLRLRANAGAVGPKARYSFLGIRQRDFRYVAETRMQFEPLGDDDEAGLVLMQNDRSAIFLTLRNGKLTLRRLLNGVYGDLAAAAVEQTDIDLRVRADYLSADFEYRLADGQWQVLAAGVDLTSLSPAVIDGFNYTGVYIGLYASGNGVAAGGYADFDYLRYEPAAGGRNDWYSR